MKIGISFNPQGSGYARFEKLKFLKAAQHGFSAIDYNISNTDGELYLLNCSDFKKKILAEKKYAAEANVTISQVHGPWRYPPKDSTPEQRQERLEKMKRSILATRLLGCKYWVVHPIMPYGTEDLLSGHELDTWDLNIQFFKSLILFAKQYGVTICLENMPMRNFSLATPSQILKFVKTINDDFFKICLDTGHVSVFPELSAGNAVRELNKEIRVLHIHDNMGDRDSHLWPTKGIIDWPDFINALNEIGFDGVLSLETAPSGDLSDEAFENESKSLYRIFKNLVL